MRKIRRKRPLPQPLSYKEREVKSRFFLVFLSLLK